MCNYNYHNEQSNRHNQPCIYPELFTEHKGMFSGELPIDQEGYCLFHSKNNKWKIENNFKERFFELISVLSLLNAAKKPQNREYFLPGFVFPQYASFKIDGLQFNGSIVLSNCIFNSPLEFLNTTLKYLDIERSTFNEKLYFNKIDFTGAVMANNSTYYKGLGFNHCQLQEHLFFNSCMFYNKDESASCEVAIKNCNPVYYISFEGSTFKTRFSVMKSSINLEMILNNCTIEDEFIFEQSAINGTLSFAGTVFTLKENKNPFMSSTHFENNELNERGKIVFKGKVPQQDMVKNEMTIHFKSKPRGLIYFENFNLNRIYAKSKTKLFEWEKEGIVEIGKGCRKYYCQTEIFTIKTSKATQTLILDLVKVFCNYFELYESANLGIELVERSDSLIRYFYFTDEEIPLEKFLEKINDTEYNLWHTFSNLSNYSAANFKDIEEQHLFIDLGVLFLKLGNYIQKNISFKDDIPLLLSSISAKANLVSNSPTDIKTTIEPGVSIVQPHELYDFILNGINKYSNKPPKLTINMKVKQIFNAPIEKVINAENFFEGNRTISAEDKQALLADIGKIHKEQSPKTKESKWESFIKKWGGTISEVSMHILKGLIMP